MLGLDRGGSCVGLCFRIAAEVATATLERVRERELVTGVYEEIAAAVRLDDGRRRIAVTYVAKRDHAQYAGRLAQDEVIRHIEQGIGSAGTGLDYVRNTAAHLRDLGIDDPLLSAISRR